MSAFFCVVFSFVGRGLLMGRSPVQGVLPNSKPTNKQAGQRAYPWDVEHIVSAELINRQANVIPLLHNLSQFV